MDDMTWMSSFYEPPAPPRKCRPALAFAVFRWLRGIVALMGRKV